MSMDLENKAWRLPDYYDKTEETSNNWKILEIARDGKESISDSIDEIRAASDFKEASGTALDIWGAIYGVDRNGDSDDLYRVRISIQQLKDKVQVDYTSWYSTILEIFSCTSDELEIESTGNPFEYRFSKFPYSRCNELGISVEQAEELIRASLPVTSDFETLLINTWANIANYTWQFVESNNHTWDDVLFSSDFRA